MRRGEIRLYWNILSTYNRNKLYLVKKMNMRMNKRSKKIKSNPRRRKRRRERESTMRLSECCCCLFYKNYQKYVFRTRSVRSRYSE